MHIFLLSETVVGRELELDIENRDGRTGRAKQLGIIEIQKLGWTAQSKRPKDINFFYEILHDLYPGTYPKVFFQSKD
jgi:hypothetical protein